MEIHWVHAGDISEVERKRADERIRSLAAGQNDLIDVRITARTSGHHKHGDKEVRIVCEARGREIVAVRSREDPALSLNEALDAFGACGNVAPSSAASGRRRRRTSASSTASSGKRATASC
jgi:ribosome-associated translation inhibitor RaiA